MHVLGLYALLEIEEKETLFAAHVEHPDGKVASLDN